MNDSAVLLASAAHVGFRLDQFLSEQLPQYSRSRLQNWIKSGHVLVNGRAEKPSYTLRGGEQIAVQPQQAAPLQAEAEDLPLAVLYEDPDVIAINKPAGMVVHSGAGVHSGTVVNALLHRFGALSQGSDPQRPGIVHRLDRYTSGVLLVARHDAAHLALARQFADRSIRKIYLTAVHGVPAPRQATITKRIARDPVHRTRMTARLDQGRTALTEYRVLQHWPRLAAYLWVRIGTGRTHQIRVHLASVGHPVLGDTLYGAPAQAAGLPDAALPGRYFLHAHEITFLQPSTGEPVTVRSPLAPELQTWLDALGPPALL